MTPTAFLDEVLDPGLHLLSEIAPLRPTPPVRHLLLAIALQESALLTRRQVGGPARGWWQFEGASGGTGGVLRHPHTLPTAYALCQRLTIPVAPDTVFEALAWCDPLAVGFARLLLLPDPAPLPQPDNTEGAWQYYLRIWRPGKPHREAWTNNFGEAGTYTQGVA